MLHAQPFQILPDLGMVVRARMTLCRWYQDEHEPISVPIGIGNPIANCLLAALSLRLLRI